MEQILWIVLLSSAVAISLGVDVENFEDLSQALISTASHDDENSTYQINIKKDVDVILAKPFPQVILPCHKKMVISGEEEDGLRTINLNNLGRFLTVISGCSSQESMGDVTLRKINVVNGGFPPNKILEALATTNNFFYDGFILHVAPVASDVPHEQLPFGGCVYVRGVGLTLEHVTFHGCTAMMGGAVFVAPYSFQTFGNRFQVAVRNSTFTSTKSALVGGAMWIANAREPLNMTELYVDISIQNCSFYDTGVFGEVYSTLVESNGSDVESWELVNNKTIELWTSGNAYAFGGAIGIYFQESPYLSGSESPSKFVVEIAGTNFVNTVAGSNFTVLPASKWYLHYGGGAVLLYISMGTIDSVTFRSVNFYNCTTVSNGGAVAIYGRNVPHGTQSPTAEFDSCTFTLCHGTGPSSESSMAHGSVFLRYFGGDFNAPIFNLKGIDNDVQGAAIYSFGSNLTLSSYTFLKDVTSQEDTNGSDIYGLLDFYTIACPSLEEKGVTLGIHAKNDTSLYQLSGKSCGPESKSSTDNQDIRDQKGSWIALCIISLSLLFVASIVIAHLSLRAKEGKNTMAELVPLQESSSQREGRDSYISIPSDSGASSSTRDSNLSWESMKLAALDSESWEELMKKLRKRTPALQIIDSSELNIIRQVATGGFKKLYLARWGWKTVAVAKLREYENLQGAGVQEMINEVLLLSKFSHPCIVQVFGFLGKEPGFVLEYLTGGSLSSFRKSAGTRLQPEHKLSLAQEVATGLSFLHSKGIIHFDIKPDNVFVEMRGGFFHAKIIDLGLSALKRTNCSHVTADGSLRGTLEYCAPEVLKNAGYSPTLGYTSNSKVVWNESVDVYSFGVLLFELWTGRMPYENLDGPAIITGITRGNLRPSFLSDSERAECILADIMEDCWQEDPTKRPSMRTVSKKLSQTSQPDKGSSGGQSGEP